ncbi:MAG: hypothetical protein EU536_03970 [Promethearchaeota archaeon]|nr:MAG: hypothetical protein EU536_03970 [Candidatus Lokiarchaeota archaeon]
MIDTSNYSPIHFSLNLPNWDEISRDWLELPENITKTSSFFVPSNEVSFFNHINQKKHLNLVPIYSVLHNNLDPTDHLDIAQVDQFGNAISAAFCPNNPKFIINLRSDFEFLCETPHIIGIQLENLEMPLLSRHLGCFCPYCHDLAQEKNIDLDHIARLLQEKAHNGLNPRWIRKKFPQWVKFRTNSVSELAGKLMVIIRQKNPELFLGLNLHFSKTPEFKAQDYFFLALFLDILNYVIETDSKWVDTKKIRQIYTLSKTFLGDIKIFLQVKVPQQFNSHQINDFLVHMQKYLFDGLIFEASNLAEIKKLGMI